MGETTARSYRRHPMEMIQSLVDRFLLLVLLTALAVPLVISEISAQVPLASRLAAEPTKFPTPEELQELIYSPWTKVCMRGQDAKEVCLTGTDGRLRNGISAVSAALIEQEEQPKRILRVTLPLGVSIGPGTRVIVDRGEPMSGPYVICFANGCAADYDVTAEFIGILKNGHNLVVQGVDGAGEPINLVLLLSDFAKAYEGRPIDPRIFDRQRESPPKPWLDDTLQPRLRPRTN